MLEKSVKDNDVNEKEIKIQRALGTIRTYFCNKCNKTWVEDEMRYYPQGNMRTVIVYTCPICNRILISNEDK